MGLFDYVTVNAPLPGGYQPKRREFQTKDTDAQYLSEYEITEDGRLLHHVSRDGEVVEVPFHGDIEFYGSNVRASAPYGVVTEDGGPVVYHNYVARFTDGRLQWIRGGASGDDTGRPVLSSMEEWWEAGERWKAERDALTKRTGDE